MLYAELKVNSVNVAVVEQLKNAYSLSYMMAKNTVAVKELLCHKCGFKEKIDKHGIL